MQAPNWQVGASHAYSRAHLNDKGAASNQPFHTLKGGPTPGASFIAYTGRSGTNFSFSSALSSAAVRPPAPFSGVGNYRGAHAPPTWTGDLSVAFPGFETPLTGPGFSAQFFPGG